MGQAILSALARAISSLFVPERLSIALSHVLELCLIIQLLKQMRLLLHTSIKLLKHKTKRVAFMGALSVQGRPWPPVTPDPLKKLKIPKIAES